MKTNRILGAFIAFGLLFCASACSRNNDKYKIDYSKFDYSLYFGLYDMKGIEIYAWANDLGVYECGIMTGTNRTKFIEEISLLQNSYPCPLNKMEEILTTYSEDTRKNAYLTIVSNPVKEGELAHKELEEYLNDDLSYLSYHLGLVDISKEEYNNKKLKTEWRENYLLTIDKRTLFNDFEKEKKLVGMSYQDLKQYLGTPSKEETIFLETYPMQYGGCICSYDLFRDNDDKYSIWSIEFVVSSSNIVSSYKYAFSYAS